MIVRFTASASAEVFAIVRYYATLDRHIGCQFIDRIDEVLKSLSINPRMGVLVTSIFRRVLLRQFPYAIYYRIDNASNSIWIETVIHQSRRPTSWNKRVQEEHAIYAAAA